MKGHTSIISEYKMKHPHFHPHPHKVYAFYSSEKMVFSRTLHNPTRTNKMGEAEAALPQASDQYARIFPFQSASLTCANTQIKEE